MRQKPRSIHSLDKTKVLASLGRVHLWGAEAHCEWLTGRREVSKLPTGK